MTAWGALPPRQPGEAISSLHFRGEPNPTTLRHVHVSHFRHRDGRIWEARVTSGDEVCILVADVLYKNSLELTAAGCRSIQFLSRETSNALSTACRFSNLRMDLYTRLIADAQGTTDHPRSNEIGVFRMNVVRHEQEARGRVVTLRYTINGIARLENGRISVFPVSSELAEILANVCAKDTIALIPQGINEISGDTSRSINTGHGHTGTSVPTLTEDEVDQAIGRLRNDTSERARSGIASGDYVPTTRHREERVIDIFNDEDK